MFSRSLYVVQETLFFIAVFLFVNLNSSFADSPVSWSKGKDSWNISLIGTAGTSSKAKATKNTVSSNAHFRPALNSTANSSAPLSVVEDRGSNNSGVVLSSLEDTTSLNYLQVEPGKPVIPVRWFKLLIPAGETASAIKIQTKGRTKLPGKHYLPPSQEPVPLSKGELAKETPPDSRVYSSATPYPNLPWNNINTQYWHGYQIVSLNVSPIEYIPATGEVYYYQQITVSVETISEQPMVSSSNRKGASRKHGSEVAAFVDNPETVASYRDSVALSSAVIAGQQAGVTQSCEYLIITSSSLSSTFEALRTFKEGRGISACLYALETSIYPYYTGTENNDNADKMRQFIRYAYENWNTRWVLLGGDVDQVPYRGVYATVGGYTELALPSDEYFACLDGPWNSDGDSQWGETNDGQGGGEIDLMAEVFVGRAPVSTTQEAANFINKVITYQTEAHPNADRAIMLGESLDSTTQGSYSAIPIKRRAFGAQWQVTERYDENGVWSSETFRQDLNSSPHVINHLGHANYTYNARLVNSQVAGLTNSFPYMMYSQGCMSGGFDLYNKSIAEEHVVDDHGAFAVIMNARYGWYYPGTVPGASHNFAIQFWDALANEGISRLGEANRDSKDDNLWSGLSGVNRWIFFELNLLGDPELELQMFSPATPEGVISGRLVQDSNGDGYPGIDEIALSGTRVYLDSNNNSAWDQGTQSFSASSLPLSLPGGETVTSVININAGLGKITDVNVTLNITTAAVYGLRIVLQSPAGKRITLVENLPNYSPNLTNTVFDDEAGTDIRDGSSPFTGSYQPESQLSLLDDSFADGNWLIEIENQTAWATGTLNSLILTISYQEPNAFTATDGSYSIGQLDDGSYIIRHETSSGWSNSQPDIPMQVVTITGGISNPSDANFLFFDDQDDDGVSDNLDCAPDDNTRWRDDAYLDSDGDGVADTNQAVLVSCYGTSAPLSYLANFNGPDNCLGVANPSQQDSDSDGIGDACDPTYDDPAVPREDPEDPPTDNPDFGVQLGGVWNGFNQQINVLECANSSDSSFQATFRMLDYLGNTLEERTVDFTSHSSRHLMLNDFGIAEKYGTYFLSNETGLALECQTMFYRQAASGGEKQLDFAYAIPAGLLLTGESVGIYNSMNPELGSAQPVYNWLSIYNPGISPFSAQLVVYGSDGSFDFANSRKINALAPGQRLDIALGHHEGQKTGLYKIIPDSAQQIYGAFLSRYSQDGYDSYNFGFTLLAKAAYADSGAVSASSMGSAINWGEVANVSADYLGVGIEVFSREGQLLHEEQRTLSPMSQYHIYLNSYIGSENVGYFKVRAIGAAPSESKLLVQSLFYGQDSQGSGQISWAYASQSNGLAVSTAESMRTFNINTFFDASSWLKLFNPSQGSEYVNITLYDQNGVQIVVPFSQFYLTGSRDLGVHEQTGSSFIGSIQVRTGANVAAELIRVYPYSSSSGRVASDIAGIAAIRGE